MRRLRVAHLRLMVPFVVIAWRAGLAFGDNSFLWHVRAGAVQLDSERVLTVDPFSFTALGESWRTQSWLAELGYAWLEDITGGIEWVPIMKFLAMAIAVGLVALAVHKATGRRRAASLGGLLLLVWAAMPFAVARPSLLGFLLFSMVVALVHAQRRPLWLLPPLFWLWASIHGMFVVGLGYVLLDALRRRSRRQVVAVGIAGLATSLTAHGFGAWLILVDFFQSRGALETIAEWQPPDFSNPFAVPLLIIVVGVIAAGTLGRLEPSDLWIVVPFVTFGVTAGRNLWPAAMALAPIAARSFRVDEPKRVSLRPEPAVVNWVIALVLVGVGALGILRPVAFREDRFPTGDAIAALEPAPLFNDTAVGGQLIYASWPAIPVFIDDRAELYGAEGFEQFSELKTGVGVEDAFEELEIHQAIVAADWPLVGYLELLGWEYRYQDDFFVVMTDIP